ncbi:MULTISPECIES: molybdopterin-dependent oxidoreductase [unclassified Acidovorax]|uniref:molybdopterin-dependent oxidoreductase n=1 Tax=unclassified Acidovorax TaxID=2684926 RepID=UPI001C4895D0|nr:MULTISPECIES: molybdopterin-dependent oxidoreductase [unclassified Acidovorax]MBV7429979.1 molybdopterin-dependent oxidoreductase [Acidovorax sp. sif0732]MBV7451372.1 molybdopterin-dependent oxidoreductase [Acidovorax sp. sif0715]
MNKQKRHFVAASMGLAGLWTATGSSHAAPPAAAGNPALLTISGAITKPNRGALDPTIDQMMGKHGIQFTQAHAFDAAALQRMAAVTIKPTLEYDAKPHTLKGPLLTTVLAAAGVAAGSPVQLVLRAVDGYNVTIGMADAQAYRMIVATHIDGQPMALGGLGPQWAVYDADVLPAFKDKPVKERFGLCPWGLYHIEVKKA